MMESEKDGVESGMETKLKLSSNWKINLFSKIQREKEEEILLS